MIKGFLSSLIVAAMFFAAGGISIAILGTNRPTYTYETASVEWDGQVVMIDEDVSGEKTWYFDDVTDIYNITVYSENVKTYIAPSADGKLSIRVRTDGWKNVSVKAERPYNDHLELTVGGEKLGGFITIGDNGGTVTVYVPDKVYASLMLDVGSGSLSARGIKAENNKFDISSGNFEYEQAAGFTAHDLGLDLGSGTARIANAASDSYKINMGSGTFDISGLTGSGLLDIGSGSGTMEFARRTSGYDQLKLGSGKLTVYIPDDTRADISTDIGSGSVSVNCCGISQNLRDDSHITLNGGSNGELTFRVDLGSGKVEFRDSSVYKRPNMFSDFPGTDLTASVESYAEQDNNSGFEAAIGEAHITEASDLDVILSSGFNTEFIGSVTALEATNFDPDIRYAWGITETTPYRQYIAAVC